MRREQLLAPHGLAQSFVGRPATMNRKCWIRDPHAAYAVIAALALSGPLPALAQSFSGSLLEAVRLALRHDAALSGSRQQVVAGEGALLSARAPFDNVWHASLSRQRDYLPGADGDGGSTNVITHQLGYKAGVSRRLASGIVINPSLAVDRVRDDAFNSSAPSTGTLALRVVLPLLKGRGVQVNTAPVTSAGQALQAAQSEYSHTLALAVTRTVNAYWDLVAASSAFELSVAAETRAGQLLANARKLAEADEIPKADLLKYEVRRLSHESAQFAASQQLVQAAQALAQAMNVPMEVVQGRLQALEAFPLPHEAGLGLLEDEAALSRLVADTVDRRLDVRAAQQRLQSARTLAEAAASDSATQLDLSLSVGYTGRADGYSSATALRALGRPAPGANVGLTLNYTLPSGNYERRGLVLQREAAAEQARTGLDALRLRVEGEARAQLAALRTAVARLGRAARQRELQTTIYNNEQRSYQAGLSTLLDLFTTESDLTNYQADWVQAQRSFAQALILFRYQTARLPQTDQEMAVLTAATLKALPVASP